MKYGVAQGEGEQIGGKTAEVYMYTYVLTCTYLCGYHTSLFTLQVQSFLPEESDTWTFLKPFSASSHRFASVRSSSKFHINIRMIYLEYINQIMLLIQTKHV